MMQLRALRGLLIVCLLVGYFVVPAGSVRAEEAKNSAKETIILDRASIMERAAANHLSVLENRMQQWSQSVQLSYLGLQREAVTTASDWANVGRLPAAMEELRELIPDYDELSEEEQQELELPLSIQSMINSSLNEYAGRLAAQQNAVLLAERQHTLDTLDDQIRNVMADLTNGLIETDKVKQLARFSALQSGYEVLLLLNERETARLEWEQAVKRQHDTRALYAVGLATGTEQEEAEAEIKRLAVVVDTLNRQYLHRMALLKQELGIDESTPVVLSDLNGLRLQEEVRLQAVDLGQQYDMKQAEERLAQAKANYERKKASDRSLAQVYLITMEMEAENQRLVRRQLEQQLARLEEQGKTLSDRLASLQAEREKLAASRQDQLVLLTQGQVAGRETEELDFAIARLEKAIEQAVLNYEMWKEKKWLALQGVIYV